MYVLYLKSTRGQLQAMFRKGSKKQRLWTEFPPNNGEITTKEEDDFEMVNTIQDMHIIIVGEAAVGKSSILQRFCGNRFDPNIYPTLGVVLKKKIFSVHGASVNLCIKDTAGLERYKSIMPSYYRNAQCAVIVYDVTRRNSFEKIKDWLLDLEEHCIHKNLVKMVIGNKADLIEREVSTEEGRNCAERLRFLFMETSALTSYNVKEAFQELTQKVLETPELWENSDGGFCISEGYYHPPKIQCQRC